MLRKKSLFDKLNFRGKSAKDIYNAYMSNFQKETEECPCCHSVGNYRIHGYYNRQLVDYCNGKINTMQLRILRLKCKLCKHTHAVLPDIIIPYASYTIRFICRIIGEKLTSGASVACICKRFGTSHSLLYRFVNLYKEHKALWLGVLKSSEMSPAKFLEDLYTLESFSDFLNKFFEKFAFSFMQGHANPSYYHRRGSERTYV